MPKFQTRQMARPVVVALGAVLVLAAPVVAQQQAGVVSNPIASPVYPGIVALERVEKDQQELRFLHLGTGNEISSTRTAKARRGGVVVSLPDIALTRLTSYSGQIDWRPVDDNGRSWYAYVASDEKGAINLLLNYIDRAGLSKTDPLRVPFNGQARFPRWSRDGKHLAFVSDSSVLYIVSDVASALHAGNASALAPLRVTTASRPALFPAWSPFGDHIAYGTETETRGVRNGAIEVLPVNKATGRPAGSAVIVTGEMPSDNEFRPSWSPDGRFVAFYVDQAGLGGSKSEVAIGVAEVMLNSRDGRVFRGVVTEGRRRAIADNVIPDEVHGPAWTFVSDGTDKKDALMYVARDPNKGSPVVVAGFQRWMEKVPREQYEVPLSETWGVVNPKSVSSTEMNLKLRYVFTSVSRGGDIVSYHDAVASAAKGPTPDDGPQKVVADRREGPEIVYASHKVQDVAWALIPVPGLGQFSGRSNGKGSVVLAVGVAGGALGFLGYSQMHSALDGANTAVNTANKSRTDTAAVATQLKAYNTAKSDYDSQKSKALAGGAFFAIAYIYGIVDAATASSSAPSFSVRAIPAGEGGRGPVTLLGFRIPVGAGFP